MKTEKKLIVLILSLLTFIILVLIASTIIIDKINYEWRLLKNGLVSFNIVLSFILVAQYATIVRRQNTRIGKALLITSLAFLAYNFSWYKPIHDFASEILGTGYMGLLKDLPLTIGLLTLVYVATKKEKMKTKKKLIVLILSLLTFTMLILIAQESLVGDKAMMGKIWRNTFISFNIVLSFILVTQYATVVKRLNTRIGKALLITSLAFLFNAILRFQPIFEFSVVIVDQIALATIIQDIPLIIALLTLIYIATK